MVSIIDFITFALRFADVAKLVDALDLGSSAFGRGGSTPSTCTKTGNGTHVPFFVYI